MPVVELHFPVLGNTLPTDHGYGLYSAISRLLPTLHTREYPILIGPIRGSYTGNGQLDLDTHKSRLRLRLPADAIPAVLPLAGKSIEVNDQCLRIGVPQVLSLLPAPNLIARLVTIKGFTEPAGFLDAVRRQLAARRIQGEPGIPLAPTGPHAGQPRRRILR